MRMQFKHTIYLAAATCLLSALAVSNACAAPPPSPDSDPNCGGHCQAICINGCDTKSIELGPPIFGSGSYVQYTYGYSPTQFRCVRGAQHPLVKELYSIDSNGILYCNDGYDCDFGPCGRDGERQCNMAFCAGDAPLRINGDGCYFGAKVGSDLKCHGGSPTHIPGAPFALNMVNPAKPSSEVNPKPVAATILPAKLPSLASSSQNTDNQSRHE